MGKTKAATPRQELDVDMYRDDEVAHLDYLPLLLTSQVTKITDLDDKDQITRPQEKAIQL